MDGLLTAAYRAGKAVVGTERVREAIERRQARLLVVAQDAGDNRQEMKRMAERLGGNCIVHAHKHHLGSLFGRGEIAVVAITDPDIAEELQIAARCALDLAEAS
jgi:ribosomal protein L7Ae-like RNA K-turn-binding protein